MRGGVKSLIEMHAESPAWALSEGVKTYHKDGENQQDGTNKRGHSHRVPEEKEHDIAMFATKSSNQQLIVKIPFCIVASRAGLRLLCS